MVPILTDLLTKVHEVDVDSLDPNKQGFFDKLFGNIKRETGKFMARYEKLGVQIENYRSTGSCQTPAHPGYIPPWIPCMQRTWSIWKELDIYIMAGSLKLKELNDKVLPELRESPKDGDPVDAQKVKDMSELISRFEKKIHDSKEAGQDDRHPNRSSDQAYTKQ